MTDKCNDVDEEGDADVVSIVGRVNNPPADTALEASAHNDRRNLMRRGQWHPSGQQPAVTASSSDGPPAMPVSHLRAVPALGARNEPGLER